MQISEAHDQPISEVEDVLSLLMDRATQEVRISTGLSTGIFLREKPRKALLSCLARLPSSTTAPPMKVLIDSNVSAEKMRDYSWWLKHPKVSYRRSEARIPHMIVVDQSAIRLEDPHRADSAVRSNTLLLSPSPTIVKGVVEQFENLFASSKVVDF